MRHTKFRFRMSGILVVLVMAHMLSAGAGAATKYKVLHRFKGAPDGADPSNGIILDTAGNLYGTTIGGGTLNGGVVYKLSPNANGSWTESVLHRFTGEEGDGFQPRADLTLDTAGNLYGTTFAGGNENNGVVYKLSPNADGSWTESLIYTFIGLANGSNPEGGLIFDTAGNLYGTTASGGPQRYGGVAYKLSPNGDGSWTESVLHRFTGGKDGANPQADLTLDAAGNLYGTTLEGGDPNCESASGCGVVFKLKPHANGDWTETVLHRFHLKDGAYPQGTLILDGAGALYGTTQVASTGVNGLVFKLTPNANGGWTETVLHQFTSSRDGAFPFAGLTFDGTGNLYGTTAYGGNLNCELGSGCGVVFKMIPESDGSWTENVVQVFQGRPAANTYGGSLVLDKAGNVYGTTATCGGGACGGVVFEITP